MSRAAAHVVIVTPELWGVTNENGGISTSVFHFARLFRRRGDRVSIVVGVAKDVAVARPWVTRYDEEGLEIRLAVAARARRASRLSGTRRFPFAAISAAVAGVIPGSADIVYFQDFCALGHAVLQRRARRPAVRPPVVTVLRGASLWARTGWDPRAGGDASDVRLDRAEQLVVEHSDFVVAPSRSYLETIAERGVVLPPDDRTRVLRHPWLPFLDFSRRSEPERSFRRLVYFGRLETRKGFDLFLDALAVLAATPYGLCDLEEVAFVGSAGAHRRGALERVADELAQLGLASRFETSLDSWQAADLLSGLASDSLVVLPSLRENFPNAVMEVSLVPGLNAIFSDVGGVREVLGPGAEGQLFAADVGSLVSAVARQLRRGPVGAGELVSYDWESANGAWLSFHDHVVASGRQRMRLSA